MTGFRPQIEIAFDAKDAQRISAALEQLDRRLHQSVIGKAGRRALAATREIARGQMAGIPFGSSTGAVRRGLARGVTISTKNKLDGTTVVAVQVDYKAAGPNRLAHLFEWGFTHRGGKRMPAYRMMTKSVDITRRQIVDTFANEVAKSLYLLGRI